MIMNNKKLKTSLELRVVASLVLLCCLPNSNGLYELDQGWANFSREGPHLKNF